MAWKFALLPNERRTWKRSPAAPVQVRWTPIGVAKTSSEKPGVGGPRAPTAPTANESNCCAVRPELSVAVTLQTYLPAARPAVLNEVDHAIKPATPTTGPPGADGVAGLVGSTLGIAVQSLLPIGANEKSTEAMPT